MGKQHWGVSELVSWGHEVALGAPMRRIGLSGLRREGRSFRGLSAPATTSGGPFGPSLCALRALLRGMALLALVAFVFLGGCRSAATMLVAGEYQPMPKEGMNFGEF